MMSTAEAQRAARGDVPKAAGRIGLAARGGLYCVAAVLAARLVVGHEENVDRRAVLGRLVDQPLGWALVAALTVGFAGYALWRFARAFTGAREGGKPNDGAPDVAQRLGDIGRGLVYVALLATSVRVLLGGDGSQSSDQQEKDWTARLLDATGGRWLVVIGGVILLSSGIYLAVKGMRMQFDDKLRFDQMQPWQRRWLPRLGLVGYTARGAVFAVIGFFIVRAAWTYDPNEAVGVDGAIKRLLDGTGGQAIVSAITAGLLGFGLFSFVEARWRKVLEG